MATAWIAPTLVIASGAGYLWLHSHLEHRRSRRLRLRAPLSLDQFTARMGAPPEDTESVSLVRSAFAYALEIAADQVYPEDDWRCEYTLPWAALFLDETDTIVTAYINDRLRDMGRDAWYPSGALWKVSDWITELGRHVEQARRRSGPPPTELL